MASTGFLADFSRRPAGQKIGIFFVLLALLVLGWYELFYAKLGKDLANAKATAQAQVAEQQKIGKDEEEYKQLDDQQKKLKQLIEDNDSALPTAAQLPAFFEMLNRKIGEAGVEVRKWDYQKEVPVDETIFKVPVEIELQGTYYQIEKFFYLLYKVNQKEGDEGPAPSVPSDNQEKDRILTVEDLNISSPEVKNGELVMTATFRASTFRKEEPPPPVDDAADKKKKPAAGAGSGSGSGTGTGGNGLLDKPQEVKDKTGDAMQKDAERVKEGM